MMRRYFLLTAFISLLAVMLYQRYSPKDFRFNLPDGQSLELVVKPDHLFLAEYDYTVSFRDRAPISKLHIVPLYGQFGGAADIHLSWYPKIEDRGPFVRFDHNCENAPITEVIDLHNGTTYRSLSEATIVNDPFAYANCLSQISRNTPTSLGYIDEQLRFQHPKDSSRQ